MPATQHRHKGSGTGGRDRGPASEGAPGSCREAGEHSAKLEEVSHRVEGANSEALNAKQAAASLQMDLATALHAQQSRVCAPPPPTPLRSQLEIQHVGLCRVHDFINGGEDVWPLKVFDRV